MKVVITEKPSVGRDLGRVLKLSERHDGYLKGKEYIVTWAFGHLIQLVNPEDYDVALKKWRLETLPIIPETFKTQMIDDQGGKKQVGVIQKLLTSPEATEVICATDAGREGELIFRYIYAHCGCKLPIKRLWISSQTDHAITQGFKTLQEGDDYRPLYHSALSRSEADWLVGMNATRSYTIAFSKAFSKQAGVMSVGRVQTPVLKLIVDRYLDNKNFKPTPYYEIFATIQHENGDYIGKWFQGKEDRIQDQTKAETYLKEIKEVPKGKIDSLVKKEKKEKPPLLYDLTELQKDANKRFKYSADHTLKVMQELYEKHKVLTYPRTSSRYLSKDIVPKLKPLIAQSVALEPFQQYKSVLPAESIKPNKRIVDDAKVTDHHAIIPTENSPDYGRLSSEEKNIYELVIKRFLSVFMGECVKDVTEVKTGFGQHRFKTSGTMIRHLGWRAAYSQDKNQEDVVLPVMKKGETVTQKKATLETKETKAPPLYNEASILAAMETAGKQIEDEELRQAMKDCGLGTPATRAQILERLITVGYVIREKNRFIATEKGQFLMKSIQHEQLTSPSLTGEWEKKLNEIAKGSYSRETFMEEIKTFTEDVVEKVKETAPEAAQRTKIGTCPKCEGDIIEMAKSFACANWKEKGCDFTIWKTVAGKELSAKLAKTLLKDKRTERLKGFTARSGRPFDAALRLDDDYKVVFDFDQELGKCPLCEGKIIETPKSFSCGNWKETGCKFTVWKEIAGKSISSDVLKQLVEKGETDVLTGFKSRSNQPFETALMLKEGRVQFVPQQVAR